MGAPNTCGRCGNPYAGAFDNEFFCEHCKHDNRHDNGSATRTAALIAGCLLSVAAVFYIVSLFLG